MIYEIKSPCNQLYESVLSSSIVRWGGSAWVQIATCITKGLVELAKYVNLSASFEIHIPVSIILVLLQLFGIAVDSRGRSEHFFETV